MGIFQTCRLGGKIFQPIFSRACERGELYALRRNCAWSWNKLFSQRKDLSVIGSHRTRSVRPDVHPSFVAAPTLSFATVDGEVAAAMFRMTTDTIVARISFDFEDICVTVFRCARSVDRLQPPGRMARCTLLLKFAVCKLGVTL
jgi:hypothetical protein